MRGSFPRRVRDRRCWASLGLELLEDRLVPSTILWVNRGSPLNDTDQFNAVFGSRAELARQVADAALKAWQDVIHDFHFADGSNTFRVRLSMAPSERGLGGYSHFASRLDPTGKPMAANVFIEAGTDGRGAGWFLDPTPQESSEFRGSLVNAFAGDAPSGSPARGLGDFFTIIVHEMSHVLGLTADPRSAFQQDRNGYLSNTGRTDQFFRAGRLFTFNGPSVQALFTSYNRFSPNGDMGVPLHTAEPANSYVRADGLAFYGSQDANNAQYEYGRRYLPSALNALILHDVYGYTVAPPAAMPNFHALLDAATGELLVRGMAGTSDDEVVVDRVGDQWMVTVNLGRPAHGTGPTSSFTSTFSTASVRSLRIETGAGADVVRLEESAAGVPVTVDLGSGDDTLILSGKTGNLERFQGPLMLRGGTGSDTLLLHDQAHRGASTLIVRSSSISRAGAAALGYVQFEAVTLHAGAGDTTVQIESLDANAAVTLNLGGGTDTVALGAVSGRLEPIRGALTINGQGGQVALTVRDQYGSASRDYTLSAAALQISGLRGINLTGVQTLSIRGGTGNDRLQLVGPLAGLATTFHGGGGTDTLIGPDTSNVWLATSANAGTLNGTVAYQSVENLIGGSGADHFALAPGRVPGGSIDGGAGDDTLDFSAFTQGLVVNLGAGTASVLPGGFRAIENAIGGAGDDLLIGSSGNNLLRGGPGNDILHGSHGRDILLGEDGDDILHGGYDRDILIGGRGADLLRGDDWDDLLIAGTTVFDASNAALRALQAEWSWRSRTYQERITRLKNGGGLNHLAGVPILLTSATVRDDSARDTLVGGEGNDWFWLDADDLLLDQGDHERTR